MNHLSKWSRNYKKCVNCKITYIKHFAHGLCRRCYQRLRRYKNSDSRERKYRDYTLNIRKEELAYIAGMIDGEGCLRIYNPTNNDGYNRKSQTILTIANTNKEVLEWIKNKLDCGNIYVREHNNPKWKPVYNLRIASRLQIIKILKKIKPYIIIKKEKLKELLEYAIKTPYRGWLKWDK